MKIIFFGYQIGITNVLKFLIVFHLTVCVVNWDTHIYVNYFNRLNETRRLELYKTHKMENTLTSQLKSRFIGCLLGGLIGDSLGSAWEFCSTRRLENVIRYYIEELLTKTGRLTLFIDFLCI